MNVTPGEYSSFVHYVERGDKTNPALRMHHASLGLSSEAGELAAVCKSEISAGTPIDPLKVLDESGDALYYIQLALNVIGWTMEDAMRWNMIKLRRRHAHGKDKLAERALLETFK